MNIKDLLDIAPQIVQLDVTIRNNGRYNYKFVLGEHIFVYAGYSKPDICRLYRPEKGEKLVFDKNQLPATFWAVNPRQVKEILDLEITDIRLTRPEKSYLYEKEGWEPVLAYFTCDIGDKEFNGKCVRKLSEYKKIPDIEKDQMNLSEFMEGIL